jgi:hypothetical protein
LFQKPFPTLPCKVVFPIGFPNFALQSCYLNLFCAPAPSILLSICSENREHLHLLQCILCHREDEV